MRVSNRRRVHLVALACGALLGCQPSPVIKPSRETPEEVLAEQSKRQDATLEAEKPTIALPAPPVLTQAGTAFLLSTGGRALILDFETGGKASYDPHPEWPGGYSGVTVGIGYDTGYYSSDVILADWHALERSPRIRLSYLSGFTGQKARGKLSEVHNILVQWPVATDVFDHVDVAREFASAKSAMPGFENLRANAQAAIISLGFNRGWQMSGPNRVEMRAIRDLVPSRNYADIADQFRKMVHIWTGTAIENGMTRRRFAEARLIETP